MLKRATINLLIGGIEHHVVCEYCGDTGEVVSAQLLNGENIEIDEYINVIISGIIKDQLKFSKKKRSQKK